MQKNQECLLEVNRIISKSPVMVFIWKNLPGWPVMYVSNNVEKWLGYSSDDFISGKVIFANIVHPEDLNRVSEEVATFSGEKNRNDFAHKPYRIISKDGQVKWFDDRTSIIRDKKGNITHYEGILLDITEIILAEELLRENEKKLKTFSYNVPGMIYSGNKDWSVKIIINSELICGYTSEDFLRNNINWIDIIYPDDKDYVFDQGFDFQKHPTSIVQEYRIITKSGDIKYVSDHKTSRFTNKMTFDGVDGIVFDITKRKESEKELILAKEKAENNELESKERVKELEGIFKLGQLAEKHSNLDDIYKEFINFVVPDSMKFSDKVYAHLSINQKIYCNKKRVKLKRNQKVLTAKIIVFKKQIGTLKVAYTEDLPFIEVYEQNLIKIYGERVSNITERIWAQQELQKQNEEYAVLNEKLVKAIEKIEDSERKFKNIFDFTKDSIVVADTNYHVFMANKCMCRMFGYSHSELITLNIKEIFRTDKEIDKNLQLILQGKMSATYDIPMQRKDGSIFFTDVTATPISLEGKMYILCSIRDITERKQLQQKILRTIIETEENERKRVSQELHDGIGPILSTIQLFTETYINSKDQEYKKKISSQLLASINEALDQVSAISSNLSPQILTDFGLHIALKKFIDKLKRVSRLNIAFQYNIENRLSAEIEITVYRIVIELINNTVKHSHANNIELLIGQVANHMIIDYSDDGIGFDYGKTLEMIKGMGLFNIQQRVKSFNGEVDFYKNQPKGIRFMIKLPLA